MRIILAETIGFCNGIKRAVEMAKDLLQQSTGNVYANDLLTHNKNVMADLEKSGLKYLNNSQNLDKNDTILIRAHGISPNQREKYSCLNCKLTDATCPHVLGMSKILEKHSKNGFNVIIIGDKNHAEIVGLAGFCQKVSIISNEKEIESLQITNDKILCVSQSTLNFEVFSKLSNKLLEKYPQLIIKDTICQSTKNRQKCIVDLQSHGAEAIIIVGGKHSANTSTLAKLSESLDVPTFHIENASDLQIQVIKQYKNIGIASGASTDIKDVQNVVNLLQSIS